MNKRLIVRVSQTQDLEIPPEIKQQLQPHSEYEMIFSQDEIILKKIVTTTSLRPASGKSLLRHAGSWQGSDFADCLNAVYENRTNTKF